MLLSLCIITEDYNSDNMILPNILNIKTVKNLQTFMSKCVKFVLKITIKLIVTCMIKKIFKR